MPKTKVKTKTQTIQVTNITKALKEAMKKEAEGWVEFALLAEEAYRAEEWRRKGYESPKQYVERELDGRISYEIFMHRVKMGECIKKFDLKKNEIVHLGWSKFKEIATLALSDENMDTDELRELIEDIKDRSHRDIKDFVRKERLRRAEGETIQKTSRITFNLIDEQDNVIREALSAACELAETSNMNIALTYICSEFLMNHTEDSNIVQVIRERVHQMGEKAQKKAPHKPHANRGRKKREKSILEL
jgi:hypothetical protein